MERVTCESVLSAPPSSSGGWCEHDTLVRRAIEATEELVARKAAPKLLQDLVKQLTALLPRQESPQQVRTRAWSLELRLLEGWQSSVAHACASHNMR